MKIVIYDNDKIVHKNKMKGSYKISTQLKESLSESVISFNLINKLKGNKTLIENAFISVKQELRYG